MAARLVARLAEPANEVVDLAAVVGDERDDALDAVGLGCLPALEPLDETVEQPSPEPGRPPSTV
jgi:hypothetical protein